MAETAYDKVAYPSSLFASTHPDRLATISRLHGLEPPPIATARVLEIGGGDGINSIAMAMAYPDARFLSFDLSAQATARGAKIVSALGLTNIVVAAGDICDAASDLDQTFDYIVAHGVYAWVPEFVRTAMMTLIGRVLSPNGVALISYNALPGGHLRKVIRDMALHHVGHIADPAERVKAGQAFIENFAKPREDDLITMRALRQVAEPISRKHPSVLFHDELGEIFEPQSLSQVAAAAQENGLVFLNDASAPLLHSGFPGDAVSEADVVSKAQAMDYDMMAFFHSTLLIRDGRRPARAPDPAGIAALYMSSTVRHVGGHIFSLDDKELTIGDDGLAAALAGLASIWPRRVRIGDVVRGDDQLNALVELYISDIISLHYEPLPGVRAPGEQPTASALARLQIAGGSKAVFTLDHRVVEMSDPGPRAFIALLDGSRDREALAADWASCEYGKEIAVEAALNMLAGAALLSR